MCSPISNIEWKHENNPCSKCLWQGLHWARLAQDRRGRLRCADIEHRRHWRWAQKLLEHFMRNFYIRHVWHPSTEDVCALRQHCGRRISRLTAAGDNFALRNLSEKMQYFSPSAFGLLGATEKAKGSRGSFRTCWPGEANIYCQPTCLKSRRMLKTSLAVCLQEE